MLQIMKKISRFFRVFLILLIVVFSGVPSQGLIYYIDEKISDANVVDTLYKSLQRENVVDVSFANLLKPEIPKAQAATFQMQTGYFIGDNSDNRTITGLGFQPDLVLIKDNNANGTAGVIFKTSSMPGETSITIAETDAVLTTNAIQSLDSDGFTVGTSTDVNGSNTPMYWVAFSGSDCSASGTFCVGSYTGNGTSQSITSVGFQPDYVAVKRSGSSLGVFKTSAHAGTVTSYFSNTANLASGGITSLNATGFSVGSNATVNTNTNTYYYFAFKNVDNFFTVGSYVGAGDNNNINSADDANLDFQPDFTIVKGATAVVAVASTRELIADRSFLFTDSASNSNYIQRMYSSGGFQTGSNSAVGTVGATYYYAVWGGAPNPSAGTGNFQMTNGSYTGTGSAFSVTGLPFSPDLVIIKHNDQATDQEAVWRSTTTTNTDLTHFLANATNSVAGAITSLTSDGFSLGTHATVNTSGDTYYWTAFGNAMVPGLAGGSRAQDFFVGAYVGTGSDNADVRGLPIGPDFLTIKRAGASRGVWRTSDFGGDVTLYFGTTASGANMIQSLGSNGFQLGTANISTSGAVHNYFGFNQPNCFEADRFCIGSYTGNGSNQNIDFIGFQPDLIWIKKQTGGTARGGVFRTSAQTGDSSSQFLNLPSISGGVSNLLYNGVRIGSNLGVNENTFTYQFAAWDAKRYTQSTYRFFENIDSTDVGSVLEAQDTPITLASSGDAFRLRMIMRVDYGNLFEYGRYFKLQYVDPGVGTCASPSGGTPAFYTDVTSSTLIAYNNEFSPGEAVTSNANDPTDGGRTIVNQTYVEINPFTNSEGAITNQNQSGKWDFPLIDNGAPADTTYCLRIASPESNNPIDDYINYPQITTAASGGPQTLSFAISHNSIGFGNLNSSSARFATNDGLGSGTNSADAHTITASTNADGGYVITLNGTTLTCLACGNYEIQAIGSSAAVPSVDGTEQFGVRASVNSGNGTVLSPYNVSGNFGFDTSAFPDAMLTGSGDEVETEFGLQYVGSVSPVTPAGEYNALLNYTITASF